MSPVSVEVDRRSDAELIATARLEDHGAYGELFRRHGDAARAAARALVGRRADIDDLVAEGFARVLNAIRRGGGPELAFRPYLLTCIRNVFYDRARADAHLDPAGEMPDIVDAALETRAASGDDRALIARAFATLPERWQLVLWHTEIEGRPAAEVAPLIGLAPNAVAALAYRAREGLREAYLQAHLQRTPPKACGEARMRLAGYARESLSTRDRQLVDTHLERCDRCRAILVELRDVAASLRSVVAPVILGAPLVAYLGRLGPGPAAALVHDVRSVWSRRSKPRRAHAAVVAVLVVVLSAVSAAALKTSAKRPELATTPFPTSPTPSTTARIPKRPAAPPVASRPATRATPAPSSSTAPGAVETPAPTTEAVSSDAPTDPTVLGNTAVATTRPRSTTTRAPQLGPVAGTGAPKEADLSVSLSPLGPAVVGHDLYLSAVVSNAGPGTANSVLVSVSLPSSLEFRDASPKSWRCTANGGAGALVTCAGPTLAAPGSSTLVLRTALVPVTQQRIRSAAATATATVSATVTSAAADTVVSSNNTSSFAVQAPATGGLSTLFATVDHGDVLIVGNTLMRCDGCAGATTNDLVTMTAIGAKPPVTASSSADLVIPPGASVAKAWLFWGAKDPNPNLVPANYTQVRLSDPRSANTPHDLSGPVATLGPADPGLFAAVDVTQIVQSGGSGTYTFASLGGYATPGTNVAGGWSLVVVTHEDAAPQRVLLVLDGLVAYNAASGQSLPLGGLGPASKAGRTTRVGIVAWDGDRGSVDHMDLAVSGLRTPVQDALHAADDVMTSVVSVGGIAAPDITANTLGFDASLIDVNLDSTAAPATAGLLTLELSASEQIWFGALTLSVPT